MYIVLLQQLALLVATNAANDKHNYIVLPVAEQVAAGGPCFAHRFSLPHTRGRETNLWTTPSDHLIDNKYHKMSSYKNVQQCSQ